MHCGRRLCGALFCSKCCSKKCTVDEFALRQVSHNTAGADGASSSQAVVSSGDGASIKCCDSCALVVESVRLRDGHLKGMDPEHVVPTRSSSQSVSGVGASSSTRRLHGQSMVAAAAGAIAREQRKAPDINASSMDHPTLS